eukprot:gene5831-9034_t
MSFPAKNDNPKRRSIPKIETQTLSMKRDSDEEEQQTSFPPKDASSRGAASPSSSSKTEAEDEKEQQTSFPPKDASSRGAAGPSSLSKTEVEEEEQLDIYVNRQWHSCGDSTLDKATARNGYEKVYGSSSADDALCRREKLDCETRIEKSTCKSLESSSRGNLTVVEDSISRTTESQSFVLHAYIYFNRQKEVHLLGSHPSLGCSNSGTEYEKWQPDNGTMLLETQMNDTHSIYHRRFQLQFYEKNCIKYKFANVKTGTFRNILRAINVSDNVYFQRGHDRKFQLGLTKDIFLFSDFHDDGQFIPPSACNAFGKFFLQLEDITALAELTLQLKLVSPRNILHSIALINSASGKQLWQLLLEIFRKLIRNTDEIALRGAFHKIPARCCESIQTKIITDISIVHELFDTADVRTGHPPIEDILSLLKHSSYNDFRFLLLLKSLDC